MRLFGLPEKGYRGEHFQKDTEPRWDDMGNYFEPETYAECDFEDSAFGDLVKTDTVSEEWGQ